MWISFLHCYRISYYHCYDYCDLLNTRRTLTIYVCNSLDPVVLEKFHLSLADTFDYRGIKIFGNENTPYSSAFALGKAYFQLHFGVF